MCPVTSLSRIFRSCTVCQTSPTSRSSSPRRPMRRCAGGRSVTHATGADGGSPLPEQHPPSHATHLRAAVDFLQVLFAPTEDEIAAGDGFQFGIRYTDKVYPICHEGVNRSQVRLLAVVEGVRSAQLTSRPCCTSSRVCTAGAAGRRHSPVCVVVLAGCVSCGTGHFAQDGHAFSQRGAPAWRRDWL